jgi:hypothetical protein
MLLATAALVTPADAQQAPSWLPGAQLRPAVPGPAAQPDIESGANVTVPKEAITVDDILRWYALIPEEVEKTASMCESGLSWANVFHERRGGPQIYCPPPKLVLTGNQLIDILKRQVQANPRYGTLAWQGVLMAGLQETFPCKDEKP